MFSNSRNNEVPQQNKKIPGFSPYETPKKQAKSKNPKAEPPKILKTFILDSFPSSIPANKRKSTPTPAKSNKVKSTPQKQLKRSSSLSVKQKQVDYKSIPKFDYELKKLLRAVFRHCVKCPQFKSELVSIDATKLLDVYAENRLVSPYN